MNVPLHGSERRCSLGKPVGCTDLDRLFFIGVRCCVGCRSLKNVPQQAFYCYIDIAAFLLLIFFVGGGGGQNVETDIFICAPSSSRATGIDRRWEDPARTPKPNQHGGRK